MDRNSLINSIVETATNELEKTSSADTVDFSHIPSQEDNNNFSYINAVKNKLEKTAGIQVDPTQPTNTANELIEELRMGSVGLEKVASANEPDLDLFLEKVAVETANELDQLEKTAEAFGERAAAAFLSALGYR